MIVDTYLPYIGEGPKSQNTRRTGRLTIEATMHL
jgi:hypothetical protein